MVFTPLGTGSRAVWTLFPSYSLMNNHTRKTTHARDTLLVQPHRAQIPAPDGQVGGGIDLPADVDTGLYERVSRREWVGDITDGHDIELVVAYGEASMGFTGDWGSVNTLYNKGA